MKKHGRKYRKLEKERLLKKSTNYLKVGEPFSKARNKRHICLHYGMIGGGIVVGKGFSFLYPVSETECKCRNCGQVFPIEALKKMELLIAYLEGARCLISGEMINTLSKGIEPVEYSRISETECVRYKIK